jgi:hypothetical protein
MKKRNLSAKIVFMIFMLLVLCTGQIFSQTCGDVNSSGTIDIVDALILAQAYVGLQPANYDPSVADVNANGVVDIVDALIIAKYYVGLTATLDCGSTVTPGPTPAPGDVDCSTQAEWSASVTYQGSQARVIYNGVLYECRWYTVNQNPEQYHGSADPWTLIGACSASTMPKPTIVALPGGNGYATRYWDCCKPHCSFEHNPPEGMAPLQTCAVNGTTIQTDTLLQSSCSGGPAYTCYKLIPWAVNTSLSYGYAATSSGDICGRCYELTFTGAGHYGRSPGAEAIQGKKMVVQAINIGYDVSGGQVDLLIPGGGVGLFNACTNQWGIPVAELGVQYGGLLSACQEQIGYQDLAALKACLKSKNDSLFRARGLTEMAAGLDWFINWYQAADNPNVIVKEVPCPSEITAKSGFVRP